MADRTTTAVTSLLLCGGLGLGCSGGGPGGQTGATSAREGSWGWVQAASLTGLPTALTQAGDGLVAAIDDRLWESPDGLSWVEVQADGLPDGHITWLAALPQDPQILLGWIDGAGLYRGDGGVWTVVETPPQSALLTALNPRSLPMPTDLAGSSTDPLLAWMSTTGGLFRTDDGGLSWSAVDVSDAGFNLLFTSVAADGDRLLATALRPAGIIPDTLSALLSAGVFSSDDQGQTWTDLDPEGALRWPTGSAFDPFGNAWLATMDQGVFKSSADGWLALGGPTDALDLYWVEGGVVVSSASRGVWRLEDARWTAIGTAEPTAGLTSQHALGHDGSVWALDPGDGQPAPAAGGASVTVALSMHVNLYHSYRGDSNDSDGYGLDLDTMRTTLGWLDANPRLRADWDLDSFWSVDSDWMRVDGEDVLSGLQQRVLAGVDDVRLMSWNNGAMSAHTRAEFDQSISAAWDSNLAAFGRVVPGVQPQECMFTPEHVGWYADQGIEWITLFNSSTPFSALRSELDLPEGTWTDPVTMQGEDASLVLVPVYHHGDLLDHGGLLGWVEQLHQSQSEDQLLVIHFDADADSWRSFDQALEPLLDLDYVNFSTIQTYLDSHDPTASIPAPYDVADGTGDGLQSWAEKNFNHEIATGIAQARELSAQATALSAGDNALSAGDNALAKTLSAAVVPRLLALSTTNFGLAAPQLHPDRVASARGFVQDAIDLSQQALDQALAAAPLAAGSLEIVNTRDSAGTALLELTPSVDDLTLFTVWDEAGQALPLSVEGSTVRLALDLTAAQTRHLSWDLSAQAAGASVDRSSLQTDALGSPFTECAGAPAQGSATDTGSVVVGGADISLAVAYSLPFCDGMSSVLVTRRVVDGLPGVVVDVQAQLGTPTDVDLAESVALTPLRCDGSADSLSWRTMGGSVLTRPVRQGVASWNGQVVDGWMAMDCTDGSEVQVSHRVTERTSLGLAPLRTAESDALLAPLGTLWGPAPMVDARRTGGLGIAWPLVQAIGSQFRPQAADWAGQSVSYELLLGDGSIDAGTLDLFAHPPLVRLGPIPKAP